ncbi:hypothetical protein O0L34_g16654 [Tuta absoluta]|nr:hypothetical protein O0L34_g16654 [Tuta absoluta]
MKKRTLNVLTTLFILALLPYSSTLTLPSGDPAPGRSPGPPENIEIEPKDIFKKVEDTDEVPVEVVATSEPDDVYDETTTTEEVITTVSEVDTVSDACAFVRLPNEEIVTVNEFDSDVNITVSHPVFDAEELVKGVVYDGKYSYVIKIDILLKTHIKWE